MRDNAGFARKMENVNIGTPFRGMKKSGAHLHLHLVVGNYSNTIRRYIIASLENEGINKKLAKSVRAPPALSTDVILLTS